MKQEHNKRSSLLLPSVPANLSYSTVQPAINVRKPYRMRLASFLFTILLLIMATTIPAQAIQRSFQNNGFETIWGPLVGASTWCWVGQSTVTPWISNDTTTDNGQCDTYNGGNSGTGNIIELWFNNFYGTPARDGTVHAELNANTAATLHQDVCVLQNEDITWRLSHRGREGIDRMQYFVGNTSTGMVLDASTGNTGATSITACQSGSSVTTVNDCTQATTNTWGDYGGSFKWLGPTAVTSINFQAISTGGTGSLTVGNFLDEVYFYLKPVVEFSASNGSGLESVATPASPKLRVVGALTSPLTVSVSIIGGTAVRGIDYTTPNGSADFTVTIPVGNYIESDSFNTGIQIINNSVVNGSRTIIMQVNANSTYIISSSQTCGQAISNPATYTILDDDANVRLIKTTIGGTGTFNYALTNVDTNLITAGNQTAASITTTTANTPVEYDANSGTAGTQPIVVAAVGTAVTITETVPGGWTVSGSCSVTGGSNPTAAPIAITTAGVATIPAANVTAGSTTTCSYINNNSANAVLAKGFSAGTIGVGQTARLTYTISNPTGSNMLARAFYDLFPTNLIIAGTPNVATTCNNLVQTTTAGNTYFNPTSFRVNANTNCTISVNVTSSTVGSYVNGAAQITSINGMTNGVTDQTLNVVQAGLTKSFNPTTIDPGGTSTLTFTLANGSGNPAQSGINFTDTLPTNVTVAGTPAITTTCPSGTGVVSASGSTITVSGATMSSSMATCTITVNVTSSTPGGPYSNTSGSISGLARLTNNVAQSDLYVRGVNLTKSFNTGTIAVGQTARLTFAIQNPSGSAAKTGLSFTDLLPTGLVIASTPNVVNNCGGTTPAPAGGATSFVVTSVNSAVGPSTCTIAVNVTSTIAGSYVNGAGQITVTSPLMNGVTDQTLKVLVPPTIAKAFGATSISLNGTTLLNLTVTNPNTGTAISGIAFTDSLPTGLTAVNGTTSVCGGSLTITGNNLLTFTGGSLVAGANCVISTTVTGASIGAKNNTTGAVTANGPITLSGVASNTATVTVRPIPTVQIQKTSINGTGAFGYTMTNLAAATETITTVTAGTAVNGTANNVTLTTSNVTITEGTVPADWPANPVSATCSDSNSAVTGNPASFGTLLGNVLTVPLANLLPGAVILCSFTNSAIATINVNKTLVPAADTGKFNLLVGATTVAADIGNTGSGNTTVPANAPVTISETAGTATNLTDYTTSYSCSGGYTATNVAGTSINIPAVNVTPGAAITCTFTNVKNADLALTKNTLGANIGTFDFTVSGLNPDPTSASITTVAGTGTATFTLKAAKDNETIYKVDENTLPAGWSLDSIVCSGSTGTTTPVVTGSSVEFGIMPGDVILCTYTNSKLPTLTKAFTTTAITVGQTSTLTFTITNPIGSPARTGLAFTDKLPGLGALTATTTTPQCGGTVTISGANNNIINFSGGSIAAGGTCTITATVTGVTAGSYINGPTNSSISGLSANLIDGVTDQTLVIFAPPTLTKSFGAATIPVGGTTTMTLTLGNPAANPAAITTARVDDTFPAGLTLLNTTFTFTPAACGTVTKTTDAASAAGDNNVRFTTASISSNATCQVQVNVTSSTAGTVTNTTDAPTAAGPAATTGTAANASLTVYALPLLSILKSANSATANPGQSVVYNVQIVNTGNGAGTSVILRDDLSQYSSFFLNSGAPFFFTDSSPASGLTLGTPEYSSDNGSSWGYLPVSGNGGAPAGYDGNVTNWKIPMTGTIRPGGSFVLNYQVVVK